jgi:cell division protein FtsW (lipid II flippase)
MHDELVRGFIVPILQALATGVLFLLTSLSICGVAGLPLWWALIGGSLVAFLAWLSFRTYWTRLAERVLIPADTVTIDDVGPGPVPTMRIELIQDEGRQGDFIDLPASQDQLAELASGLTNNESFSQARWCGAGKPFTRSQFEQLRGELLRRGLISWLNPHARQQGYSLTIVGRHVVTRLAAHPPGRSH